MRPTLVLILLTILGACESRPSIRLAWPPEEPASQMSKILADILAAKFNVETSQYANHQVLYDALVSGNVELAIMEQHEMPDPKLNAIAYLYPSVLHVLSKNCGRPRSIHDLVTEGSVFPGATGSAGHRLLSDLAKHQIIPPLDELRVLDSPFGEDPDVLMVFGGILSTDALSRLAGYCLISLGDPNKLGQDAWVEGLAYRFPRVRPFVIPAGLYPHLSDTAVMTLAIPSLLVVGSSMIEEDAYQISSLVQRYKNKFLSAYPLAAEGINNRGLTTNINIPFHPGAQRFMNRDAPTFLERYVELLALLVTLTIAIISGAVAVVRIRRQAKKNRLDEYFSMLLEIRQTLQCGMGEPSTAETIIQLQNTVTALVVDERVSADSSLVAFYALSNQILLEARGEASFIDKDQKR